jgi:D-arabinose 1-dehydrogenase-like Zn-dependent alcohol dehydrogenase
MALIPAGLSAGDAGPLMCAGITTFNALRSSGARPGETVAVLGWVDSAIWAFSLLRRWVSRPSLSREGWTKNRWLGSLVRDITLIVRRRMRQRNWPRWAVPG